ncbi:MAG: hypothetical protein H6662_12040 [Ardenticatenaceae bacterium]|nr:hypothetical protein [Anaerolineales bacterium]MCB8922305.1 hypothetical protein [Ardenticatenaceae bacterium]MCB8990511.1 hypothetical protein [Ardenticatenaceae bacterium]
MKSLKNIHVQEKSQEQRAAYEAPAIIYETIITTRAGSPLSLDVQDPDGVDPADLFGN